MNRKILKKDLKRKKSMNLILLLFVLLATTFIAASLNNLKIVTNGIDYYFEQAQVKDFLIDALSGTNGEKVENDEKIEAFLESQENVTSYDVATELLLTENQIEEIGDTSLDLDSTLTVASCENNSQKFFDEENQEITSIKEGEVYYPRKMFHDSLKAGDSFYIVSGDYKKKFTIKGVMKDAILGAEMMGMNRILISEKDFKELQENGVFASCKMYSISCDDVEAFKKEHNNSDYKVLFGDTMKIIRTTYVMDLVITGILLMISICLILIAVIMLRFTIVFTVNEDYKEIGIMKAIGILDFTIRSLYLTKYFMISLVGAVIGCLISIPFSQMLIANVTENIVVQESKSNLLLAVGASAMVVLVVVWFAYLSTGKIKHFTPMDAIRSGNNGERFQKKTIFTLGKSKMRATTFMALNDVLCEWRKYMVLLVTSIVGVWLVVMPVNTINTLQSDRIADWFGMAPCDFIFGEQGRLEEIVLAQDKKEFETYIEEVEKKLNEGGIEVDKVVSEAAFRFKVRKGDNSYNTFSLQGIGTTTDQYMYDEGQAPAYDNEVAITHVIAEQLDASIGDTVYISMWGEEIPFVVTAIYQSMNNMGEGLRFHQDAEVDYSAVYSGTSMQVILKDTPTEEELTAIIAKVKKIAPEASVETTREYIDDMIGGISEQLKPVKGMLLVIVILINILVVVLMQKMFLIREQGEMGMLKAIGFSNGAIIGWQTKRIALILLVGIVIGTVTGTPFSQVTSGEVFKYMGASRIEFQIHPWEVYVLYPVALFVVTLAACVVTMLKVRKISVDYMKDAE